jgi:ADP-ribosylglycohydrolase
MYDYESPHQNGGQNRRMITGDITTLRCLGKTVTNQNYIHEENEVQSKLGEWLYYSVKHHLIFMPPTYKPNE